MWTRSAVAAGISATILGCLAAPAAARLHEPEPQSRGYASGRNVTVEGQERIGLTDPGRTPEQARATMAVPACPGNNPNTIGPGSSAGALRLICPGAVAMCARTPGSFLYWLFTGPPGVGAPRPGQWTLSDQRCLGPGEARPGTVSLEVDDLRRLPLPPATITVQPATRTTLVGLPLRLTADARATVISTRLLGRPVRVRVQPVRLRWTFGDGTASAVQMPMGSAPPTPSLTLHAYRTTGVRSVALTTIYAASYSVAGGPWRAVDGYATVPSPPQLVTVLASRAELVARP